MHNFFDFVTDQLPSILLLVFGFGFVIFWHELGHFLAAKWADVRVEQFAVGFGQALFSWRKGIGWTTGSSGRKLEALIHRERELSAARDSAAADHRRRGAGREDRGQRTGSGWFHQPPRNS